jgi:hypothetical protein
MKLNDLTSEQRAKIDAAKSPEDIQAIAREGGYELSNEELEGISGGDWNSIDDMLVTCPNCGNQFYERVVSGRKTTVYCINCNTAFEVN